MEDGRERGLAKDGRRWFGRMDGWIDGIVVWIVELDECGEWRKKCDVIFTGVLYCVEDTSRKSTICLTIHYYNFNSCTSFISVRPFLRTLTELYWYRCCSNDPQSR